MICCACEDMSGVGIVVRHVHFIRIMICDNDIMLLR